MQKSPIVSYVERIFLAVFFFSFLLTLELYSQEQLPENERIDCVYTWVDGADPKWQEIRNHYFHEWYPELAFTDSNSKNRYRNRDELRYSLRSIEKFAPFFHHIYIVTFGQKPKWLKETDKITIIDHQEIFLNKSDLPTFNSQAIEANLHRIPNLNEKFVYFNDDVFLSHPCSSVDFFTKEGAILLYLDHFPTPSGPVISNESLYSQAWRNTDELLNTNFVRETRFVMAHAPFSLTKSLMKQVEDRFSYVFTLVSSHKFRMPTDYTLTNGLIPYYAFYTGQGTIVNHPVPLLVIGSDAKRNKNRLGKFNKKNCRFFCVQDTGKEDNTEVDDQVTEFLKKLYPQPATWEIVEEGDLPLPETKEDEGFTDIEAEDEEEYDEFHTDDFEDLQPDDLHF